MKSRNLTVSFLRQMNRIGDVMVGVLTPCPVYRGFEPRSDQTKDYKIGINRCFCNKHTTLRNKIDQRIFTACGYNVYSKDTLNETSACGFHGVHIWRQHNSS
jgi:hypothetical protein